MSEFKTGVQVQLKSGGPLMTVQSANADHVGVAWYCQHDKIFKKETFAAGSLQVVAAGS